MQNMQMIYMFFMFYMDIANPFLLSLLGDSELRRKFYKFSLSPKLLNSQQRKQGDYAPFRPKLW